MDRQQFLVGIGLITVAVIGWLSASTTFYEPFHLVESEQDGEFCEQYEAQCLCVGHFSMNATYPPGYACDGYRVCRDINRTVCPAGP